VIVVIVDASVLVGELLRERGPALFRRPDVTVLVADEQWEEAEHELERRLGVLVSRGVSDDHSRELEENVQTLLDEGTVTIVAREHYEHVRDVAIRRVPRNERDWPTVAAALALDASILTADADFLGCGVATWTVETLLSELASG
jgi:hypothetical protein